MADITNYEDVMVEETELDEVGGRDLSTLVGVGLIAGAGVVVYEGGKKGFGLLKSKVIDPLREKRAAKKAAEASPSEPVKAESPNTNVEGEAK